jgi:hypothetical protein
VFLKLRRIYLRRRRRYTFNTIFLVTKVLRALSENTKLPNNEDACPLSSLPLGPKICSFYYPRAARLLCEDAFLCVFFEEYASETKLGSYIAYCFIGQ